MALLNTSGVADAQRAGTTHYATLDAMRGIAAIMVMLNHVGMAWGGFGYLAVDLFFLMSGFVIARAYESKLKNTLSFVEFFKIRVLRLYPALVLGVLIAAACSYHNPSMNFNWWMVLKSLILLPTLDRNALFPLNNVLWSLFFELIINMFYALTVGWLTMRWLVIIVSLSGITFLIVIVDFHTAHVGTSGLDFIAGFARVSWSYFAGVLIARYRPLTRVSGYWSGTTVILVTLLLFLPGSGVAVVTGLRVIGTIFLLFPLCIYFAVAARPIVRGRRACKILGGLSYPLYTIHYPLIGLTVVAIRDGKAPVSVWFVILPAIVLLAYLVEKFYDAPIRNWLRKRYRAPATASAIASK